MLRTPVGVAQLVELNTHIGFFNNDEFFIS